MHISRHTFHVFASLVTAAMCMLLLTLGSLSVLKGIPQLWWMPYILGITGGMTLAMPLLALIDAHDKYWVSGTPEEVEYHRLRALND